MYSNYNCVSENSIVVLKPTQQFLNIINRSIADSGCELNLQALRLGANSYLIPGVDEVEDGIKYVDKQYRLLFELELASWELDHSALPHEPNLELFLEWFDIEVYPMLVELAAIPTTEPEANTLH